MRPVGQECSITFLVFPYHGLVKMAHYYSRIPDKEEITFTTSSDQSSCTFSFLQLGASKTENSSSVSVSHTNITELVFMHATEETSMHFIHKPRVHSVFQNFTLQVFKR